MGFDIFSNDLVFSVYLFYTVISVIACTYSYFKVKKMYDVTSYKGMSYLKNAFLFYGVGILLELGLNMFKSYDTLPAMITKFVFILLMALGGFNLVYSLFWKEYCDDYKFVIVSSHIAIFLIALLDTLFFYSSPILFYSQMGLFAIASFKTFTNFTCCKERNCKFRKHYFVIMLLAFIAWTINYFGIIHFNSNTIFLVFAMFITTMIFISFAVGITKYSRRV